MLPNGGDVARYTHARQLRRFFRGLSSVREPPPAATHHPTAKRFSPSLVIESASASASSCVSTSRAEALPMNANDLWRLMPSQSEVRAPKMPE
jgi:hypothetical protein